MHAKFYSPFLKKKSEILKMFSWVSEVNLIGPSALYSTTQYFDTSRKSCVYALGYDVIQ